MTWLARLIAFLRPHRPLPGNSVSQPVIDASTLHSVEDAARRVGC